MKLKQIKLVFDQDKIKDQIFFDIIRTFFSLKRYTILCVYLYTILYILSQEKKENCKESFPLVSVKLKKNQNYFLFLGFLENYHLVKQRNNMWRQINNSFCTFPKLPPSAQRAASRENRIFLWWKTKLPLSLNLDGKRLKGTLFRLRFFFQIDFSLTTTIFQRFLASDRKPKKDKVDNDHHHFHHHHYDISFSFGSDFHFTENLIVDNCLGPCRLFYFLLPTKLLFFLLFRCNVFIK